LLLSQKSKADPLLNTDDASITAAQHCQLESSYTFLRGGASSYQITPACNLGQNFEVSLGYHATQDLDNVHGFSVQAKTVIKPMDNHWGLATSLMMSRDEQSAQHSDLDWFLNVPMSFNLIDNRLGLNTNIGYQYGQEHVGVIRWGIATNYSLSDRLGLSAETYNQDRQAPFFQAAVNYSLIPNILTLEASIGDRLHAFRQRWFGLGLSFTPSF
jgi:hypothetical protein